jgi:hypothetical protein
MPDLIFDIDRDRRRVSEDVFPCSTQQAIDRIKFVRTFPRHEKLLRLQVGGNLLIAASRHNRTAILIEPERFIR